MIVKNDMKKVTLLIPVYNEEAMLPTLYQRLIELVNRNAVYEWEILFVNDGSKTATTVIPTPAEADEILFHSDGKAVINVEKYDIVL